MSPSVPGNMVNPLPWVTGRLRIHIRSEYPKIALQKGEILTEISLKMLGEVTVCASFWNISACNLPSVRALIKQMPTPNNRSHERLRII